MEENEVTNIPDANEKMNVETMANAEKNTETNNEETVKAEPDSESSVKPDNNVNNDATTGSDNKKNSDILQEQSNKPELYSTVRGIAIKILNRIDNTDAYLDKLLEYELKNSELNGQDKSLLFEIVHGVIRWMGRIDWILNGFYKGQYSKCIPTIKNSMRVALYQILFLDKVPDYAAVNEAVEFIKRIQGQKPADTTNGVLRNIIRSKNAIRFPDPDEDITGFLSAYYSHPAWMIKKWLPVFGREGTEALLTANNDRPSLTLRVNTLKTNKEEFKELLNGVGLRYFESKYLPEFIKLRNLTNITDWEYFDKGFFGIQDESTGFSCKLLEVKPGMKVLDMCAAPGGKTAYLAALMNNTGQIIALDRFESRIKILDKNLARLGITNVKAIERDAITYGEEGFDKILLDAPCSGLGTLSKKPDIKWKRSTADIRALNITQINMLRNAGKLVKPGGSIVYSTCTIEAEENIGIIKKFLSENPNFKLFDAKNLFPMELIDQDGCIQTYPHIHRADGAFAARLDRIS